MKLQADMKAFRAALATVGKIIPQKSPIPIALCIRIATNDNRIILTGTDFTTTVEFQMAADVLTEGEICVGYATLAAFCAAAKSDAVMIEVDKLAVTLRSGKSRITLAAFDPRDFPNYLPAEGDMAAIDPPTFAAGLRFCAAAASEEDARYYLKGVAVIETDAGLTLWGTDGHGMHRAGVPLVAQIGGGGIVPTDAALMIAGMIDKLEAASLMVSPEGWHVMAGPARAWGKMIEGTYPAVQKLVDGWTDWQEFIVAPKAEIESTLAIAACGADTQANRARSLIIRAASGGAMVVRGAKGISGVHQAGRAETMTPAKADAVFTASSTLLGRAIAALGAQEVSLSHSTRDGTPAVLIAPAQGDANLAMSAIVMGILARSEEMADV